MRREIQPEDLYRLLCSANPPRVVDVRTPEEFDSGHIAGSMNVPLHSIDGRLPGVEANEAVVMVCQAGLRSTTACLRIQDRYPNLFNLSGGTSAWIASGLPCENSAIRP